MVLLMGMFGTAQPALLSFPEERPVFLREYSTNHYSVVAYFLSRLTIEAVITAGQILLVVSEIWWVRHCWITARLKLHLLFPDVHHVLHDWFPGKFWIPLHYLLWSRNGIHRACGDFGMQCGRSQTGARDAPNRVCAANVVCRVLCGPLFDPCLVALGTVSVFPHVRRQVGIDCGV